MRVLEVIGGTLVLALLLLLGFLGWQTAANSSATKDKVDELNKNVTKLLDEMHKAPEGSVSQKETVTQKDLDELRAKVVAADLRAANQRLAMAEYSAALAANSNKLAKVEKDQQANLEVVNEQRTTLGQIATKDAAGNSIVSIWEQTKQSPQFKDDLRKAVVEVTTPRAPPTQPWGTVRIENRMLNSQNLEVNGISYLIAPKSSLDVNVSPGWATTRLVEYEAAKRWWVGAPNYIETVIIDPRTR